MNARPWVNEPLKVSEWERELRRLGIAEVDAAREIALGTDDGLALRRLAARICERSYVPTEILDALGMAHGVDMRVGVLRGVASARHTLRARLLREG